MSIITEEKYFIDNYVGNFLQIYFVFIIFEKY